MRVCVDGCHAGVWKQMGEKRRSERGREMGGTGTGGGDGWAGEMGAGWSPGAAEGSEQSEERAEV